MKIKEELEKTVSSYIQEIAEGHINPNGSWSSGGNLVVELNALFKKWALEMVEDTMKLYDYSDEAETAGNIERDLVFRIKESTE